MEVDRKRRKVRGRINTRWLIECVRGVERGEEDDNTRKNKVSWKGVTEREEGMVQGRMNSRQR